MRGSQLREHIAVVGVALLALVVAVTIFTFAGAATGGTGIFHTNCDYDHSAMDDPIVHPGVTGASHMHDFFGNKTTNAFSTLSTLKAGTTTCAVGVDKSGYWAPQLIFNGTPVQPARVQAYYLSKAGPVVTPPTGLELVAGNAHATAPLSTKIISWNCSGIYSGPTADQSAPPVCPSGSVLKVVVFFPNCWDGFMPTGQDNTSHTTYAVNGTCPNGFNAIAQLRAEFKYPAAVDGRGNVAFASGPYYTMHADWFNAWDSTALNNIVSGCINANTDCGSTVPIGSPSTTVAPPTTTPPTTAPPTTTTTVVVGCVKATTSA